MLRPSNPNLGRWQRTKLWRRAAQACILVGMSCCLSMRLSHRSRASVESIEWAGRSSLSKDDPLPLAASCELIAHVNEKEKELSLRLPNFYYLADFGILDLPVVRQVRARAGVRYSGVYPRGALEAAVRKESVDDERGYATFVGFQSTGDDNRLDILCEAGAEKEFRDSSLFYTMNLGWGGPYSGGPSSWRDGGSSFGVRQHDLPPAGRGELTVGWRTRLFSSSRPGAARFTEVQANTDNNESFPLQSTPYARYRVPIGKDILGFDSQLSLNAAAYPQHNLIFYQAQLKVPSSGGDAVFAMTTEQSMKEPWRLRFRVGASYSRG